MAKRLHNSLLFNSDLTASFCEHRRARLSSDLCLLATLSRLIEVSTRLRRRWGRFYRSGVAFCGIRIAVIDEFAELSTLTT
jgi:hypothetical protein